MSCSSARGCITPCGGNRSASAEPHRHRWPFRYRTEDRFASGPLAMIADARDAVAWVRAHAGRLSVNPARVVVAGFSSGGAVAALLATTSAPGDLRGAVLMSSCVAPLGDAWFRRMTEGRVSEIEVTPAAHVGAADPATLAVHGDADEMCPYSDTAAFVQAAKHAGVDSELLTLPGATHFFAFRSPEARARAAEAIEHFSRPPAVDGLPEGDHSQWQGTKQ